MTGLKHINADAGTAAVVAELLASGGVIIDNLLDSELIDAINRDVDPLLTIEGAESTGVNPMISAFFGDKVRHVSGLAGKSRAFAEQVMTHPGLLEICDAILLPNCADYRLNLAHLMDRGPGSQRQYIHRDEAVWIHYRKARPELQLATMIALVDFSHDNGATCVIPGSHRWEPEREPQEEEIAYAEMTAGSAVIYLGSTLHGGGTNTTDQWRRGIHMSYCLGWLRTEENNVLAVPPDIARELSPRACELLGYGIHDAIADLGGYLGMVDMHNPRDMLKNGRL
jgi:ectoine hydroxylase-related dioxygenase (phytanoyl-CoA dioxygenase family)